MGWKTGKNQKEVIINDINKGGLRMPYLNATLIAAKLAWVKRILDTENKGRWKVVMLKLMNMTPEMFQYKFELNIITQPNSLFHRQILVSWLATYSIQPTNIEAIVNEKITLNKFIKIGGNTIPKSYLIPIELEKL